MKNFKVIPGNYGALATVLKDIIVQYLATPRPPMFSCPTAYTSFKGSVMGEFTVTCIISVENNPPASVTFNSNW